MLVRPAVRIHFPLLLAIGAPLSAQSTQESISPGPLSFHSEMKAMVVNDSNIALATDALRESDTIVYLRPGFLLEGAHRDDEFSFKYLGDFARYAKRTGDDYNGQDVAAQSWLTANVRNHFLIRMRYQDSVDGRGTLNLASTPTPDRWHESGANGLYAYGADGAKGRIEIEGAYSDRQYINNRALTFQLDHSQLTFGGTFFVRLRPRIYATMSVRQASYSYKDSSANLDSKDTFTLVGLRWDATAVTTGQFSIGNERKEFTEAEIAAGRRNFSGIAWDGTIAWRPLAYSTFNITTRRGTYDYNGLGDFIVSRKYELVWNHEWRGHVTSAISASRNNESFANAPLVLLGNRDRNDSTGRVGAQLRYEMPHAITLGAEYLHTVRDSNDLDFLYRRNIFTLTLTGTL